MQESIAMSLSDLGFAPSTLEVDYDKNLTDLYRAITDQDWERAVDICKSDPEQAKTWVVRHYDDGGGGEDEEEAGEIMWRFLPLHSACARQPPISVVAALLRAYPDGARCQDDQGMYALHYACGNQAAKDVVRILLVSYQEAARKQDPRGMLPIHYLACWGPSSVSVVDMLLVANPNVASARDIEGNTPLDLAREGEYPEKDGVVAVLQKWFSTSMESGHEDNGPALSKQSGSSRFSRGAKHPLSVSPVTTPALPRKASSNTTTAPVPSNRSSSRTRSSSSRRATKKQSEALKSRQHMRNSDSEEKKDDDSYHQPPMASRRQTVKTATPSLEEQNSLLEEIAALKAEKQILEEKLADATMKAELQQGDIVQLREALEGAKLSSDRDIEEAKDVSKELEKTKAKLKGCTEELKGLRITMVDMMEEHDELKQRSAKMNDRLRSLSVSLEALMAQQKDLAKVLKARSEERKSAYRKRKESMRMLIEMEELNEEEDESLELKLKKQTKEMEALAAMIEAARD